MSEIRPLPERSDGVYPEFWGDYVYVRRCHFDPEQLKARIRRVQDDELNAQIYTYITEQTDEDRERSRQFKGLAREYLRPRNKPLLWVDIERDPDEWPR